MLISLSLSSPADSTHTHTLTPHSRPAPPLSLFRRMTAASLRPLLPPPLTSISFCLPLSRLLTHPHELEAVAPSLLSTPAVGGSSSEEPATTASNPRSEIAAFLPHHVSVSLSPPLTPAAEQQWRRVTASAPSLSLFLSSFDGQQLPGRRRRRRAPTQPNRTHILGSKARSRLHFWLNRFFTTVKHPTSSQHSNTQVQFI